MKKLVLFSLLVMSLVASNVTMKCVGCHGVNGEKNVMSKELIPNQLTKEDIITKLKLYRDNNLSQDGKGMLMFNSAKDLNDSQIKQISDKWGK